MNFFAYHEAKSKYAYMADKDTIHLRLFISEGVAKKIEVISGDPFSWGPNEDDPKKWEWKKDSKTPVFMYKEATYNGFDHYFASVKPITKRMKYSFIVNDRYLISMRSIIDLKKSPEQRYNLFYYYNYPFLNEEDMFQAPNWVKDQIWYSIFPERFRNGDHTLPKQDILPWGETESYHNDQRFGGDLEGIIESLPYLKEVGFTGIYMTPIFESDTSHKYDINDYFKIDPAFGTTDTLTRLVSEAHKLDMKVMLDAVFNHCGVKHPMFQDVIAKGKDSPFYDCFYILDDTLPVMDSSYELGTRISRELGHKIHQDHSLLNYRTFAFSPYMPKLNTNHPLMKQHLLDVATYWIKECDIDGWRLDVSNEIGHRFWRDFRNEVKKTKKDAYIVGENWDDAYPWLQGDQYDAVMNYGFLFPIWDFFGKREDNSNISSEEFISQIYRVLTMYPKNVIEAMYNLVDSHDTTRILEICGNNLDLVKLPYVFMFTLPGAPSIYYGGEVGLSGKHDPDNRRCMLWGEDQNHEMLNFMKKLIQIRKEEPILKSSDMTFLENDHKAIFIQKQNLYVILFNEEKEREVLLPKEMRGKKYIDLFLNEEIVLEDKLTLSQYDFLVLKEL